MSITYRFPRLRRLLRAALLCLLVLLLGYLTLYLWHRPFRAAPRAERFELLAHRVDAELPRPGQL